MSNQQARQFLENFACDELAEIEIAQHALERAETEVVQTFAARMIKLHRELGGEIHRLDHRLALHLQIHLDSRRLTEVADLAATGCAGFDRRYIEHEIAWFDHALETVRHLGPAENDEVLLYLARQMELLEANLHLALQTRSVLELIDSERATLNSEGAFMTSHDQDKETRRTTQPGMPNAASPSSGPLTGKAAGQKTALPTDQSEADRLAGKGTGMDTDSSQGSNLGL